MLEKTLLLHALTIVVSFILAGCSLRGTPDASPVPSIQPEETALHSLITNVNISGSPAFDDEEVPERCHPEDVAMRISQLFQAINNKEVDSLPTFFSEEEQYSFAFLWKSELEAEQLRFLNLEDLSHFLDARYAQNETLTLTRVQVNSWEQEQNVAHFLYHGDRVADDLPDQNVFGKGALYCESSTFAIIGIVPEPAGT